MTTGCETSVEYVGEKKAEKMSTVHTLRYKPRR